MGAPDHQYWYESSITLATISRNLRECSAVSTTCVTWARASMEVALALTACRRTVSIQGPSASTEKPPRDARTCSQQSSANTQARSFSFGTSLRLRRAHTRSTECNS